MPPGKVKAPPVPEEGGEQCHYLSCVLSAESNLSDLSRCAPEDLPHPLHGDSVLHSQLGTGRTRLAVFDTCSGYRLGQHLRGQAGCDKVSSCVYGTVTRTPCRNGGGPTSAGEAPEGRASTRHCGQVGFPPVGAPANASTKSEYGSLPVAGYEDGSQSGTTAHGYLNAVHHHSTPGSTSLPFRVGAADNRVSCRTRSVEMPYFAASSARVMCSASANSAAFRWTFAPVTRPQQDSNLQPTD